MISIVIGVVVGGAMLGIVWMLAAAPLVFARRSGNGQAHTLRQNTRDAWMVAYAAGVASYVLLLVSGLITY